MTTFTLQRDTDQFLSEQLDDRTLLNLCIAKPSLSICSNDDFWRNRFLTKYGSIDKSPGKSWKTLYLQLIYYLDKSKDINERMVLAARGGHRDLVDYFISKGAFDWDWGMYGAAAGGHRELVDYFISKGADYWDFGMDGAAEGGHRELVDYFIDKGADNWKWGMESAAQGGHQELVEFFRQK